MLENYYRPDDWETQIGAFIGHYDHQRHHGSLKKIAAIKGGWSARAATGSLW